ncbi:MAG TPA: MYXO-CTERM sorting domain-containing protein [Kofleriaceae bacterium]|nr:MYXO-CTERM sorting domain-containing protein [Kofleriaceae bacterium]
MTKSTGVFLLTGFLGLLGLLGFLGLSAGTAAASPGPAFTQDSGVWQRSPHGCGTRQRAALADAFAPPPSPLAVGLRVVYLNRNGGTYTRAGSTDSAANRVDSTFFDQTTATTFTIPPLAATGFNWTAISSCVRAHFRRFNINVVETEPTSGSYIEAVVGGTGQEIGFGPNELFGIASADNFCSVTEKGIAFNFSETHRDVPRRDDELCATIAHEVGHLLALEHEQLATDILSYVLIADSGSKSFINQAAGCGTSPQTPASCTCNGGGGGTTNSYMRLSSFIGLRALEAVPPVLAITAPGGVVPPTFDVVVTATDNAMMSDVVALIDDVPAGSDLVGDGDVYVVTLRSVTEGAHRLSVIATDASGNMTRKEASITVQKLTTGETCADNAECAGDLCAQAPGGNFCTQTCDRAADNCPDGFTCDVASGGTVCLPTGDGGCGCGAARSPGPMLLFVLAVGAVLLRRRRAR